MRRRPAFRQCIDKSPVGRPSTSRDEKDHACTASGGAILKGRQPPFIAGP